MKAVDVVQRLGGLNETDRAWILDRLSPSAKRSLLQDSNTTRPAAPVKPAPAPAPAPAAAVSPESVPKPARRMGLPLTGPAWLIAAVLQAHDEADRERLLKSLSVHLRQDVERVRRSGIVLTKALRERLLRLSEKCGEADPAPVRPPSRFEALVEKVSAARSRRQFWLKR